MGKSKYLIIACIILLTAAGIFAYDWWQQNYRSSAWPFIPSHAVMVVETDNPVEVLEIWRDEKISTNFKQLPYFRKVLLRSDSLLHTDAQLEDFFANKKVLTSLHVTARDDFDYLFFIPLRSREEELIFDRIKDKFSTHEKYKSGKRNFQGHLIHEIAPDRSGTIFSFTIHQKFIIGSYTPFLVEDAIRTINDLPSLQEDTWKKTSRQSAISKAGLQMYVQPESLPKLMQVFAGEQIAARFPLLSSYAKSSQFEIKADEHRLRLDGISSVSGQENSPDFLQVFAGQSPQPLQSIALIPNNTALLYHWGFNDPKKLSYALQKYWQAHDKAMVERQENLRSQYNIRSSALFEWMQGEIALAILENSSSESQQLLFIQAADMDKAIIQLSNAATAIATKEGTAAYIESYADVQIRQIHVEEFPAAVLGSLFNGFEECFYAPVKGYIVFSNNIQNLKQLLDDIQRDDVWSYSLRQKQLIEQTAIRDNFGVFIHTSRAWNLLANHASPKWKILMRNYSSVLKRMEYAALQMRYEQGQTYRTNILVRFNNRQTPQKLQNKFFVNTTTRLDHSLYSPAFVVRNHTDRSREILVQDAARQVYLIDTKGKILWKKPLNQEIISQVSQIDFFKNNKLQYLFATPSQIYVIDRNGSTVENFPVTVPNSVYLHTLAAIDYDNNRDYRFLASDLKGDLYLYNKQGNLLEDWNPLSLGYRLNSPATHIRIRGKDYILALQADGILHVLNRKAKPYAGFPLLLNSRIRNPLIIEPAVEPEDTRITMITDNGEMLTSNLLGNIVARRQFYRPSRDSYFKLCVEANGKDWLLARYTDSRIALLDQQGNTLFEKEYNTAQEPLAQYYNFGGDIQVVAITHPAEGHTYLYDMRGKAIGEGAITNKQPVSILYVENYDKLLIYRADRKEASLLSVKLSQ